MGSEVIQQQNFAIQGVAQGFANDGFRTLVVTRSNLFQHAFVIVEKSIVAVRDQGAKNGNRKVSLPGSRIANEQKSSLVGDRKFADERADLEQHTPKSVARDRIISREDEILGRGVAIERWDTGGAFDPLRA